MAFQIFQHDTDNGQNSLGEISSLFIFPGEGERILSADEEGLVSATRGFGTALGVATLGMDGKVPLYELPDVIVGQLKFGGTYDGDTIVASSSFPDLNGEPLPDAQDYEGLFLISSADYTNGGVDYLIGDWILSTGIEWTKVDNTDAVTTVFGRIGPIVALESDYESFYPKLSEEYNNPTWINQLAWSKITGTPTTLSGYGITNAYTQAQADILYNAKENLSNKATSLGTLNDTLYPTTQAVSSFVNSNFIGVSGSGTNIRPSPALDLSSITNTSVYYASNGATNVPLAGGGWVQNYTLATNSNLFQLFMSPSTTDSFWYRNVNSGIGTWRRVANREYVDSLVENYLPLSGGTLTGTLLLPNGSVGAPSLTSGSDTDTGIHFNGTNAVSVATGGIDRFTIATTGTVSTLPIYFPNGTAATPSLSFISQTDKGMYSTGSDGIGLSTAGVNRLNITNSLITANLPIALPSTGLIAPITGSTFLRNNNSSVANATVISSTGAASTNNDVYIRPGGDGVTTGQTLFRQEGLVIMPGPIQLSYTTPDVDGTAGSGNAIVNGFQYTDANTYTNIPFTGGTLVTFKNSNSRAWQLIGSADGRLAVRSLHVVTANTWHELATLNTAQTFTANKTFSRILTGNGTDAAPGQTFSDDPATGMYLRSANYLGLTVGGTTVLGLEPSGVNVFQRISGTSAYFAGTITAATAPTDDSDLTNKAYVDGLAGFGLSFNDTTGKYDWGVYTDLGGGISQYVVPVPINSLLGIGDSTSGQPSLLVGNTGDASVISFSVRAASGHSSWIDLSTTTVRLFLKDSDNDDIVNLTLVPATQSLQYSGNEDRSLWGDYSVVDKGYVDLQKPISASYSQAVTAVTSVTVTIGQTMANTTYKVVLTPRNVLSAVLSYVSAKTTTTFTVTYMSALTGTVAFDWAIFR